MEKPQVKKDIDWSEVVRQAREHIDSMETGEYHEDNDDAEYIYEAVIEAVYGENVWDWIRSKQE